MESLHMIDTLVFIVKESLGIPKAPLPSNPGALASGVQQVPELQDPLERRKCHAPLARNGFKVLDRGTTGKKRW
jgi:hypothetical protein